jgi:hypothetical protein
MITYSAQCAARGKRNKVISNCTDAQLAVNVSDDTSNYSTLMTDYANALYCACYDCSMYNLQKAQLHHGESLQ